MPVQSLQYVVMSLRRHGLLAAVTCALTCLVGVPAVASAKQAPLPKGWPSARMQLGMRDDEGGADALRQSTKLGMGLGTGLAMAKILSEGLSGQQAAPAPQAAPLIL